MSFREDMVRSAAVFIHAAKIEAAAVVAHHRHFYRSVRIWAYAIERPIQTPVECCKGHAEVYGLFVAGDWVRWRTGLVPRG